jgi:hypothetical protein
MKQAAILIISTLFLGVSTAFAEISLKAEVDKTRLTLQDKLTYTLTVSSTEKKIPSPQLPLFKGFRVVSRMQSSRLSFVNLGLKTQVTLTFLLVPFDAGKFKIEASAIKIKDQTYTTDEFEINVEEISSGGPEPPPEHLEGITL